RPAVERRFIALLMTEREELGDQLRHALSLLKSAGYGIDWRKLLRDIEAWSHPERLVQRRWARHFWRSLERTDENTEEGEE
ncbi:MAG: type I-E CRISPR-associated protein Cse2/CasB, partial [Dehalococcoidia bacterium]|nr:type I-E CRISPR-associated protein Cse2/CasB [Dehalococcoidia bacterium]